jgi:hypothetical protein
MILPPGIAEGNPSHNPTVFIQSLQGPTTGIAEGNPSHNPTVFIQSLQGPTTGIAEGNPSGDPKGSFKLCMILPPGESLPFEFILRDYSV